MRQFYPGRPTSPSRWAKLRGQSYPQQTPLWITLWRACGTRRRVVWTTVDEHVDNWPTEHTFDALNWAFLFHTVCGELGFNYPLKVPI